MPRKAAPLHLDSKFLTPPAASAVEHVAKLASSGAFPTRMVTAVEAVVGSWRAEDAAADEMQEWLEQLHAVLDGGVLAVENAEGTVETNGQRRAMQVRRIALWAAREAVTRALGMAGG